MKKKTLCSCTWIWNHHFLLQVKSTFLQSCMNVKLTFSCFLSEKNIFAVPCWHHISKAKQTSAKKTRTLFNTPKQKQHEKFGVLLTKFTEDQTHLFHQGFQILRERRNVLGMGINNSHFFLPAYFFKHLCSFLWSLHGNWFNSALNNKFNNLW